MVHQACQGRINFASQLCSGADPALSRYTWKVYTLCMRTNINIDDSLLARARKLTRLRTKRDIVNRALEVLVESEARKDILRLRGSGIWKGNLKAMRRNRA